MGQNDWLVIGLAGSRALAVKRELPDLFFSLISICTSRLSVTPLFRPVNPSRRILVKLLDG
jgi:hypothetical protein